MFGNLKWAAKRCWDTIPSQSARVLNGLLRGRIGTGVGRKKERDKIKKPLYQNMGLYRTLLFQVACYFHVYFQRDFGAPLKSWIAFSTS